MNPAARGLMDGRRVAAVLDAVENKDGLGLALAAFDVFGDKIFQPRRARMYTGEEGLDAFSFQKIVDAIKKPIQKFDAVRNRVLGVVPASPAPVSLQPQIVPPESLIPPKPAIPAWALYGAGALAAVVLVRAMRRRS